MKKFVILFLISILFFSSCIKDPGAYGYYNVTTFRGVVIERFSNKPLSNILVYVANTQEVLAKAYTDSLGCFSMEIPLDKLTSDYFIATTNESRYQTHYIDYYRLTVGSQYQNMDTLYFEMQSIPELVTVEPIGSGEDSFDCYGFIVSDGYSPIIERGFVYDTIKYPTINHNRVVSNDVLYEFHAGISPLPNKKYYVRAYAINEIGINYSDPVAFNSHSNLPDVVLSEVSNITATSVTCDGEVTSDGGRKVLSYGLCWSMSPQPTMKNSHAEAGYGVESFSFEITNLLPSHTYYVRAYAQNDNGVSYSNQMVVTTENGLPEVTTAAIRSDLASLAVAGGEVILDGGFPVIRRGICFGTSPMPTISNNHTVDGSGLGSFVSQMTNLTPGVTYYYRAYATNGVGTVYGDQRSFTAR